MNAGGFVVVVFAGVGVGDEEARLSFAVNVGVVGTFAAGIFVVAVGRKR